MVGYWKPKGGGFWGETTYAINAIPFGGFVKIFGENPDDESKSGPDSSRSFVNAARWKQIVVLIAGVLGNFIFAWLLIIIALSIGAASSPQDYPQYANRMTNERIMIDSVSPVYGAELNNSVFPKPLKALLDEKSKLLLIQL